MPQRQVCCPVLIQDGTERPLTPVELTERMMSEKQFQEMLFRHPGLLPVQELEPIFEGLVPLALELPIDGRFLDILYVNAQGYLTLVETKLWRNPESRRAVVSQIIEYANGMSKWTFEQLSDAVKAAGGALIEAARKADEEFDEKRFIDTVSRNLRLGRLLLLIVGDGIQEGVEELVDFLNRTPQLGFTLALVEIGLFRVNAGKDEPLLIQPRILARTREVTRAVVEVRMSDSTARVDVSVPSIAETKRSSANVTEAQFLERLAANAGAEVADAAKWILQQAPSHRLSPYWGKRSMAIYYPDEESGYSFSLGHISENGDVPVYTLHTQCKRLGLPDEVWQGYFADVARLVPGATIDETPSADGKPWAQVLVKGEHPNLRVLGAKKEEWLAAIDRTTTKIAKAMQAKEARA